MSAPRVQLRSRVLGVEKRAGAPIVDHDIALVLRNDCDVFKPNGEPLLLLRRGVIDTALADTVRDPLSMAARKYGSNNRSKYAGLTRVLKVDIDGRKHKNSHTERVDSSIIGYFDRQGGRFPFCRETVFTSREVEAWASVVPLVQFVANEFRKALPERYAAQEAVARSTNPAYVIADTPFSTLTVNRNIAGRIHLDKGDYKAGFGCIAVFRRGSYSGGELVFPEYRCGVDLRDGDLLFFDAHCWHGVTDLVLADENSERISVVFYFRTKMTECLAPKEELMRAKLRP